MAGSRLSHLPLPSHWPVHLEAYGFRISDITARSLLLHDSIKAIAELNKMERINEPEKIVDQDIKVLVVHESPKELK